MSGVFRTIEIDPPPHLHPASVSSPRTKGRGVHTRWAVRGWGVIFWKTPDIGLASYNNLFTSITMRLIQEVPVVDGTEHHRGGHRAIQRGLQGIAGSTFILIEPQCCGSMPFWCGSGSGSGSADPWHFDVDPDPEADPDPAVFIINLRDANQKLILKKFSAYYFLKVHLNHFSKIKSKKKVTKQ